MIIYNTLNKKNIFLSKNNVFNIYTCGITVYDYCHIGHARLFIFLDFILRYLNYKNYNVISVRNITDIDDKIIKKANYLNISFKKISERFKKKMHIDIKNLNLIEPSFEPKATFFIFRILKIIDILNKKKYAYFDKKNVYYNVNIDKDYGALSNILLKKNKYIDNNDFVLWKNNKYFPNWNSKWGKGRPGWHSECASMCTYYFKNIDLHIAGRDLLFPHNENEYIQIKKINNSNVKIWMHLGNVKIKNIKMSKSKNNYILIKNCLNNINEECIRYMLLSTHYKKDINFDLNNVKKFNNILRKFYSIIKNNHIFYIKKKSKLIESFKIEFENEINNNFNLPGAFSVLFKICKKINKKDGIITDLIHTLIFLGNIIGILKYDPRFFFFKNVNYKIINDLIKKRNLARKKKNWNLSDKLRKKLLFFNVIVKDNKIN